MRTQHVTVLVALLLATRIAVAQSHDIPEHGLRVNLPLGWQRMEALSGNTILKLARTDAPGKEARIVIVTSLAEEFMDLSTISRDDHIRALEAGSLLGEKVSALDVGHTQVGGITALWGKTYRDLPSRGPTREYTYEFIRENKGIPKGFTIRLTSYGDENWFRSNSVDFDRFIQSIAFNQRPPTKQPIAPQTQPRPEPVKIKITQERQNNNFGDSLATSPASTGNAGLITPKLFLGRSSGRSFLDRNIQGIRKNVPLGPIGDYCARHRKMAILKIRRIAESEM